MQKPTKKTLGKLLVQSMKEVRDGLRAQGDGGLSYRPRNSGDRAVRTVKAKRAM